MDQCDGDYHHRVAVHPSATVVVFFVFLFFVQFYSLGHLAGFRQLRETTSCHETDEEALRNNAERI